MSDFPEEFVWFELIELSEPVTNGLRVVIAESITRHGSPHISPVIGTTYPMTVGPDSRVFEFTWDYTAAYFVTNESYFAPSTEDVTVSASAFREYSKSGYLEYIRANSNAEFIRDQPLRHWYLGCQNHFIDVAAWDEPLVRRLENYRPADHGLSNMQH